MRLSAAGRTAPGYLRERNEDGLGIFADDGVIVVCDGMGGSSSGAVVPPVLCASLRASLRDAASRIAADDLEASLDAITTAAWKAHEDLRESLTALGPWGVGAGAAAGALWLRGEHLFYAHAGDTKLYLLRDGALTQLWEEHTLAREYARTPGVDPAQAAVVAERYPNVITRAFGVATDLTPDVSVVAVRPGDTLVLVTDGAWRELHDGRIASLVADARSPDEAVANLFDALAETAWNDNATAVVARVVAGERPRAAVTAPARVANETHLASGRWLAPQRARLAEARAVIDDSGDDDEAWERLCTRGLVPASWVDDTSRAFAGPREELDATPSGDVLAWEPARWGRTTPARFVCHRLSPAPSPELALRLAADGEHVAAVDALAREVRQRMQPWGFAGRDRVIWMPLPDAPERRWPWGDLSEWLSNITPERGGGPLIASISVPQRFARWRDRVAAVVQAAIAWAHGTAPVPSWNRATRGHPYADMPSPFEPMREIAARGYLVLDVAREGVLVGVPR